MNNIYYYVISLFLCLLHRSCMLCSFRQYWRITATVVILPSTEPTCLSWPPQSINWSLFLFNGHLGWSVSFSKFSEIRSRSGQKETWIQFRWWLAYICITLCGEYQVRKKRRLLHQTLMFFITLVGISNPRAKNIF